MSSIEPALPQDGHSILRITAEAGVFNLTEVAAVEELWNDYLEDEPGSSYTFLVYRMDEGTVAGFACFGPHSLTEGTYDLFWIAVDPDFRGRGIGQALLAECDRQIQNRGGRIILIETSTTNPYGAARRLYEHGGYSMEAFIRDFYSPGDSLVIYTKHLEAPSKHSC